MSKSINTFVMWEDGENFVKIFNENGRPITSFIFNGRELLFTDWSLVGLVKKLNMKFWNCNACTRDCDVEVDPNNIEAWIDYHTCCMDNISDTMMDRFFLEIAFEYFNIPNTLFEKYRL